MARGPASFTPKNISLGIKALNRSRQIDLRQSNSKPPSPGQKSLSKTRQKQNDNLRKGPRVRIRVKVK